MEFTPDKLEITLIEPVTENGPVEGRKYTLTHSDETGMLFLDIGNVYNYSAIDQDYDDDEDGLSFIEMECPNCSEVVEIDEELLFDDSVDVICPNCHAVILSSEDDCDDCDDSCGCGCGCEVESEDEEK